MTSSLAWLTLAVLMAPMVGSAIVLLLGLRYPRSGWPIVVVTLVVTSTIATVLLAAAWRDPVRFEVGNIPSRYGIELVADGIAGVLIVLTLLVMLGAVIHLRRTGPRGSAFNAGILLLTGGTLGVTLAGDLFNLYVFLEISAIASYALISSSRSPVATYAAFKYLLLGTIGATLYLLGIAYVFVATGTLNMVTTAAALEAIGYADPIVVASFVLIGIGLAIKIALFPLHTWLADAHAAAPDAISAIVSGVLPAIAVYALARITFTVYSVDFLNANVTLNMLLLYAGLITIFAGGLFALMQRNIKLLLAYSTISNMGLAVVGIALATEESMYGALLHLFGHGVAKAALFLLAGVIVLVHGAKYLDEYAGIAKQSPWLAGAFTLLGISLIGMPPTVGFMGKYYIVLGAMKTGSWLIALLVLASTLVTIAYIVPIIDRLYFHSASGPTSASSPVPRGTAAGVAIAIGLSIALGLVSVPLSRSLEPGIEVFLS